LSNGNEIILGDCLEILPTIADNSIDLVISDPPYILENGGDGPTCLKGIKKIRSGLDDISDGFDVEGVFSELERVCKKVNFFIFCSNKQISLLMQWGEERGYYTTLLCWHKTNATPFSNGVWKSDLEFIIHIREKGATFQGDARVKTKVYEHPIVRSEHGHPTEKPISLYERYMEIGSNPGDTILDCFSGSGTCSIAAHTLERNCICIEKDYDYHRSSVIRLEQHQRQLKLF